MELRDYIRILRRSWLLVVLVAIIGMAAAAGYSLLRTPKYDATSTVFVSASTGDSVSDLQQGNSFTLSRVATYTSLVTTPAVMDPVIKKLDLNTTPIKLAKTITANNALNTALISISATDPDPARAAAIANGLATSLTTVVERIETPQGATASPVRLTPVTEATPPLTPSSPKVPLNLALGLLIGLAIGIGIAVTRSVLDTRIHNAKDLEQVTDAPLIGAIVDDPQAPERPLVVHSDPLSVRAEAFRSLRTNMQFLDLGGRASFVVTSSLAGEGKSTTSVNVAIALADAGKKVALLDTDLRKPMVAQYMGIEGGAGLTDVLIGRTRVGDVMHPWGQRSLYVMPAGRVPPNPSELLGSEQMRILLEALERDFDVVLCDAPPLLPVTDAAILAKATSGAIVVTAAARTHRAQLSGAIDVLQTVGAKVAGIVLTMVPTRGPDAYGYGYGYMHDAAQQATHTPSSRRDPGPQPGRRRSNPVAAPPVPPTLEQLFGENPAAAAPPTTATVNASDAASTTAGGPSRIA